MKIIFYTLIILILLLGCGSDKFDYYNNEYLRQLSFFKDEFINHFPKRIDKDNMPFSFHSGVIIKYQCIFMEYNATYSSEQIKHFVDSISVIAAARYDSEDSCLLVVNRFHNSENVWNGIRLTKNDKKLIVRDCYNNKLPVQNFYRSGFASNETEWGLPIDFVLYVLDAKKGKYWDDKYLYGGKYMPPEWEHGYSKGIAISKVRNIMLYWFVIW